MEATNKFSAVARIEIRFHDCDPLGIVWHGNYVKYFEAAREAFGKKYNLDYMEMYINGYATPIIHLESNFKKTLQYKDVALVEAIFRKTDAAKIIFDYVIRNESTNEIVCLASTTQVFVTNGSMQLSLVTPDVFLKWKQKNGL
jgi:acyl-CoA thioester hydrolase